MLKSYISFFGCDACFIWQGPDTYSFSLDPLNSLLFQLDFKWQTLKLEIILNLSWNTGPPKPPCKELQTAYLLMSGLKKNLFHYSTHKKCKTIKGKALFLCSFQVSYHPHVRQSLASLFRSQIPRRKKVFPFWQEIHVCARQTIILMEIQGYDTIWLAHSKNNSVRWQCLWKKYEEATVPNNSLGCFTLRTIK